MKLNSGDLAALVSPFMRFFFFFPVEHRADLLSDCYSD